MAGQQLEEDVEAAVHPARLVFPVGTGNEGLEGVDVKVFLHVNREMVRLAQASPPGTRIWCSPLGQSYYTMQGPCRLRDGNHSPKDRMSRRQRHLGYRIAIGGLLFVAALTLFPAPGESARAAATPLLCVICGDHGGVDVTLNILLFLPLGLGLGLAGLSWRRVVALAALATCCIELLQMKVIIGRDASLGDILANTLGGGLGALAAAHWRTLVFPGPRAARRLAGVLGVLVGLAWLGTAWALQPSFPTDSPWFGGWAPELGNYVTFPGTPLAVTAGGDPLLPGPALDQARIQAAVIADPSIAFRAVLGPMPGRLAPIGQVVDGRQRDMLFIGQERRDLAFTVRLRANSLRLWSPQVNLRNGLDGEPGDTAEASGSWKDGAITLRSQVGDRVHLRTLPVSASWGWALVTPWSSVLGEEASLLSALWIIGLLGLLGYWAGMAGGAAVAVGPATAGVALGIVPMLPGISPSHPTEWLAALVGLALGTVLARMAKSRRTTADNPTPGSP